MYQLLSCVMGINRFSKYWPDCLKARDASCAQVFLAVYFTSPGHLITAQFLFQGLGKNFYKRA